MKRKIALGMIFVMVCYIITLSAFSVGASLPIPEIMPQVTICEPSCGPYFQRCSEVEVTETLSHTFDWDGYTKTCVYTDYWAYTFSVCRNCGSRSVSGTHWHGEDGHDTDLCGMGNLRPEGENCFYY